MCATRSLACARSATEWHSLVEQAINDAYRGKSRLTPSVLAVPGLTSPLVKHFLNNLCAGPDIHYLEVGSWKGATITAASCRNPGHFTAVDDFSQWPAAPEFHVNRWTNVADCHFEFLERNCWDVRPEEIAGPVDVYFYDGEHSFESQVRAFTHFDPCLADEFVAMVDDWNYADVRNGTLVAFSELGYEIVRDWELPARFDGDRENWWNGLYVAVIRKQGPRAGANESLARLLDSHRPGSTSEAAGAQTTRSADRGRNLTSRPIERDLTSIIIPCCNQLEFTRQCITALLRHTRKPWELLVIDNGSMDGTAAYLAGLQDAAPVHVEIITNPTNLGFPAACNQGLAAARGEYLVLLNNDAVVTDSWLDQLIALAESDAAIAMVGPMSNYASPPQLVGGIPYTSLEAMQRFAVRWRNEHLGHWFHAEKLSGFCLLVKRRVLEVVGGLDERFGIGFFDDDDLARRVQRAGYLLAVAHDLFVHHFGSRTFVGAGLDAEALLAENQAKYAAKWGDAVAGRGQPVTLKPWAAPPAIAQKRAGRARVSLTMIVRNEEANLPACLESAADLFDEIVIVDTGSTDTTQQIARSYGARLFDFVWVGDFAAARNAALARATGDYIFWLDADDQIEPHEHERLRELLDGLDKGGTPAAYVIRCACDPDPAGGGATVVDHVRLFPNLEDVRWTFRVHEQILPALRRADIEVRWTDVTVRHTGYNDPVLRRRKLDRDLKILNEELQDRPEDPFVLFNLGCIAIDREDGRAAIDYFRRSLKESASTDSITRKLYALIARAHQMCGEPEQALQVCAEGLGVEADDAELLFREAVVRRNMGDRSGAEDCWRKVLTVKRPEKFSSLDVGIYGHLTRRNLAALAEERGDLREAMKLWSDVLTECPGDHDGVAASARLAKAVADTQALCDPATIEWLLPGSRRKVLPSLGPGDFDPYLPLATAWVRTLNAKVVVELGVRLGASTRAFLAGVESTGGHVWGVDLVGRHNIADPLFSFIEADAATVVDRWDSIDLLHIDTDPHTEEQTRQWFELYAAKCRAIALHDTHHPEFGVGAELKAFFAAGGWRAYEYWGNASGWTVLVRDEIQLSQEMIP